MILGIGDGTNRVYEVRRFARHEGGKARDNGIGVVLTKVVDIGSQHGGENSGSGLVRFPCN